MCYKILLTLLFLGLVFIAGCSGDGEEIESAGFEGSYTLAILPQYSDEVLTAKYQALADYLSAKTGAEFTLVFADDFVDHVQRVNEGEFDFAFQNPVVHTKVAGSTVLIAQELKDPHFGGNNDKFRGVVFTRLVDGVPLVPTLLDIMGKRVSMVSYISAGGYISQMMTLEKWEIDTSTIEFMEAEGNSQENVLRDVYEGRADVGFVRATTWGMLDIELERPDELVVIAETEWLPNWAFTAKNGTDPELIEVVKEALLKLTDEDLEMIDAGMMGFREPDVESYDKITKYLKPLKDTCVSCH